MVSLALGVKFNPNAAGLLDFQYLSVVPGYSTPASQLTNGKQYRYRAELPDLSQWEWGTGTWTSATTTLSRTTIQASSAGGAKVSFSATPQIGIVIFPADIANLLEDNTFTGTNTFSGTVDLNGSVNFGALTASTALALDASKNVVSVTNTGSGLNVLQTSPALITPDLGTPSAGVATNLTGTASGLTAGHVTTNANLTGDVTSVGNATTLANIPTATPAAGTIIYANIAAPASPAVGKVSVYSDSTDLRFHDKNASGVIGTTVVADTGASNNFLTAISAAGAISKAQPAFTNLSGNINVSQMNSGTGASSSTFWRGDGTWAAAGAGTVTSVTAGSGTSTSLGGASGGSITTSGTLYNTGVVSIAIQTFTASGTYTPTTGMIFATIECWGSGAGGGGAATGASAISGGGGGGAGGYSTKTVSAATVGASQTVTVGTAGTGGSAGNNAGTAGNDVSVGTLCVGKGGSGGGGAASGGQGAGGAGGVAGTGDLAGTGGTGQTGVGAGFITQLPVGGAGANSSIGGGGAGNGAGGSTNGAAATGFAAGGAGGSTFNNSGNASGGNGSKGFVKITEYINR